jgi:hypothetical protein
MVTSPSAIPEYSWLLAKMDCLQRIPDHELDASIENHRGLFLGYVLVSSQQVHIRSVLCRQLGDDIGDVSQ